MEFSDVTFRGPQAETAAIAELPLPYRGLLTQMNGFIAFRGGLHVRGVCSEPTWHSLAVVWSGDHALHRLFTTIRETDIPFGQDCLGDQFILRDNTVHRLSGESGELESTELSFKEFLNRAVTAPVEFLGLQPLLQFENEGGRLEPGRSLAAFPPFIMKESGSGVSLRSVPTLERISFLANLARQLAEVPDGGQVKIEWVP